MKKQLLPMLLLLTVLLLVTACVFPPIFGDSSIEFNFLENDSLARFNPTTQDIDSLVLQEEPWLTQDDIVFYDWSAHLMFLNKNIIRAKSTARYMKAFDDENEELSKTMKTHFIDIDNDGRSILYPLHIGLQCRRIHSHQYIGLIARRTYLLVTDMDLETRYTCHGSLGRPDLCRIIWKG